MRARTITIFTVLALGTLLLAAPQAGAAKGGKIFGLIPQHIQLDTVDINAIQDLGANKVRALVVWDQVQSAPGPCSPVDAVPDTCSWGQVDQLIGGAAAGGAKVTPFIFGSLPEQTGDVFRPPLGGADQRDGWQQFLTALVQRYGPNGIYWTTDYLVQFPGRSPKPINVWQIWNEPGSPTYYHPKPNPRSYARLLKISRQALKRGHPKAKLMIAGLFASPDRGAIRGRIPAVQYLRRLYNIRGAKSSFDYVAVHPYSRTVAGVLKVLRGIRREMRAAKDAKTKVSISELGWSSNKPNGSLLAKGRQGQARMLRSSFNRLRDARGRFRLMSVYWFSLRDIDPSGPGSCPNCPWAGLLELDGSPKPSYRAFRSFTR
jgi:hypothetical protein